jgi:hypothetical protein
MHVSIHPKECPMPSYSPCWMKSNQVGQFYFHNKSHVYFFLTCFHSAESARPKISMTDTAEPIIQCRVKGKRLEANGIHQ